MSASLHPHEFGYRRSPREDLSISWLEPGRLLANGAHEERLPLGLPWQGRRGRDLTKA